MNSKLISKVVKVEKPVVASRRELFCAIDLGSTCTRTILFDAELEGIDDETNILEVSSEYSILERDIDHITSNSNRIIDNLEIVIVDETQEAVKPNKVFNTVRLVKGTLLQAADLTVDKPTSMILKSQMPATYYNLISNLALRAYLEAAFNDTNATTIKYDLTVAIPPEDKKSSKNIDSLKTKIAGVYLVKFPRLDYEVRIILKEDSIFVEDEASATLRCCITMPLVDGSDREVIDTDETPVVLVCDGGGRSFDFVCVNDGVLVTQSAKTGKFGGETRFYHFVRDSYVEEVGYETSIMSIKSALLTGKSKDASGTDMIKHISSAKVEMAKLVWETIKEVLDQSELKATDVNLILCSGGMFKQSTRDGKVVVESLMKFVKDIYKTASPNTKFLLCEYENPIVLGLAFYRASLMD